MLKEIGYDIFIIILIPALGSFLGIIFKYGFMFLKLKLAKTKFAFTTAWIDKLVQAAEKKWSESGMGETKKEFVSKIIKGIVSTLKLGYTDDEIDGLIEASVSELDSAVKKISE